MKHIKLYKNFATIIFYLLSYNTYANTNMIQQITMSNTIHYQNQIHIKMKIIQIIGKINFHTKVIGNKMYTTQ